MSRFANIIKSWIAYAAIITLLCGIVYIVVQQNFRAEANDPQFQMAQDAVTAINNGVNPETLVVLTGTKDIATSLAPYLVIYDVKNKVVATGATLNGESPKLPVGVLADAHKNGTNAVTWQPQPGIRQATVVMPTTKGYIVLAGRSLRLTEERIDRLGQQVLFGWFCSVVGMLLLTFLLEVATKPAARRVQVG